MRRIGLAVLSLWVLVGIALGPARPAHAEADWCWGDPVVRIGGTTVAINIGVLGDSAVVDKDVKLARTTIYLPEGVSARVVGVTKEFFPETVHFVRGGGHWRAGQPIPVRVEVSFVAKRDLPTVVQITYPSGAASTTGTTLGQMATQFTLP